MSARIAWCAALAFAVACGETVRVPIELGLDDPSCQGAGFLPECAASVRVELSRLGAPAESQCLDLNDGLGELSDLAGVIESVRFSSLSEGDEVSISISVFDQSGCDGAVLVTGTSALEVLDSALRAISVDLSCEATESCGGDPVAFSAVVREIFGDDGEDDPGNVTVGYSTTRFAIDSALSSAGNGRFTGTRQPGIGCVSVGVGETFGGLPFVSCELATGQDGADQFAFAASSPALRSAVTEAELDAGGVLIGRVVGASGGAIGGAVVSVEDGDGDPGILYFDSENGVFVGNAATFGNGIFAIRGGELGCCATVIADGPEQARGQVEVHLLENAVAAARIVSD